MILLDVNVLVYAQRRDLPQHEPIRGWLEEALNGPSPFGLSDLVVSGFLRVVTHPRAFMRPTDLPTALTFAEGLRERPNRVRIDPGPKHWTIFTSLCSSTGARGNRVPDAYLAALAIESGSEWVTTDRGFARYPDLRWRHPLDAA